VTSFGFPSVKNDLNAPSKRNKQKNLEKNQFFFVDILKAMTKIAGSGFATTGPNTYGIDL
jgi:hypothetical protein